MSNNDWKAGSGGNAIGGGTAGDGGGIMSDNSCRLTDPGYTWNLDKSKLTAGDGGGGKDGGIGGSGGSILSGNAAFWNQNFSNTTATAGTGGWAEGPNSKAGKGGSIGSNNK